MRVVTIACLVFACLPVHAADRHSGRKSSLSPLSDYIEQYAVPAEVSPNPTGSLWNPQSTFAQLSSDYRAQRVNDLLTIHIVEQTLAQNAADVTAQRKLQTTSGITSVAGQSFSELNPLLALNSDHELTGKGQADSTTKLQTSLAARVAAILPSGVMVVEAERRVHMNNETQTIVLRGMVRPADVQADNSVLSTSLANLEIELKGKGVISDATRPPNRIVRALLWLTGF